MSATIIALPTASQEVVPVWKRRNQNWPRGVIVLADARRSRRERLASTSAEAARWAERQAGYEDYERERARRERLEQLGSAVEAMGLSADSLGILRAMVEASRSKKS